MIPLTLLEDVFFFFASTLDSVVDKAASSSHINFEKETMTNK